MKYTAHTLKSAYDANKGDASLDAMQFAVFSHEGQTFVTMLPPLNYLCMKIASEAKLITFIETSFEEMHSALGRSEAIYLNNEAFIRRIEDAIHMPLHGGRQYDYHFGLD